MSATPESLPVFANGYPEIDGNGSKYDNQQRIEAAITYAHKGTFSKTQKATGIPDSTLYEWSKTDWWDQVVGEVRTQNNDLYVAEYGRIIKKATKQTLDKLPEASARDAMIIAATANDKLRLALNQPTSISGKAEGIDALKEQFRELSAKWDEKQVNVVATQEKRDCLEDPED